MRRLRPIRKCVLYAACLAIPAVAVQAQSQPTDGSAQVLDRVVAVVNNQAILWSDITNEMRFAVLDAASNNGNGLNPKHALQQLVSRTLIQQQIRQDDASTAQPDNEEVRARIGDLRRDLPACVRLNCSSDAGWQAFLKTNGLTAEQIQNYLHLRLEVLRFIEIRFRQGIRISPQETEAYYREKLLPRYAKGARVPALSEVAPRIEEILLEQQVNVLFGNWLENLRKQGDVEVLDPALEAAPDDSPAVEAVQ